MTKRMLGLLTALVLAMPAQAYRNRALPNDGRGDPIAHPLYGGYDFVRVTGTTETLVCSGKCVLAGLLMATGATTNYVLVRDSIAADAAGTKVALLTRFERDTRPSWNMLSLPVFMDSGITVKLDAAGDVTVLYIDLD